MSDKFKACRAACGDSSVPAAELADAAISLISVPPPPGRPPHAALRTASHTRPLLPPPQIFDLIKGMGIAKSDMMGNADVLKRQAEGNPGASVQELIKKELEQADLKKLLKGHKFQDAPAQNVCVSMLWLQRALIFICVLLETLQTEPKLKTAVDAGYAASLKQHHGFVVKGVFAAASNAAPSKEKFVGLLADEEEAAMSAITEMLPVVKEILNILGPFMKEIGAETGTYPPGYLCAA